MIGSKIKIQRNLLVALIVGCIFLTNVVSFSAHRSHLMMAANEAKSYTSDLKPRSSGSIRSTKRTVPLSSEMKLSMETALSCDLKIKKTIGSSDTPLSCYFEKSSSCSSCKTGICPVDNRPCGANRDYLDHVYGARYMPKPKPVFQSYKYSQQSQMHMYAANAPAPPTEPERKLTAAERRSRRQKLFLMSTWLEDLLPNPSQGRSWMFNSICDTMKITTRVGRFIISFIMMLTSASTLSSPSEE